MLGATGGIGSALCRRLAARGVRLTVAARDCWRVRGLATELAAHAVVIDATCPAHVERCSSHHTKRFFTRGVSQEHPHGHRDRLAWVTREQKTIDGVRVGLAGRTDPHVAGSGGAAQLPSRRSSGAAS